DAIIGREGSSVVPLHIAFELPGHGHAIGGKATILAVWNLGRQDRHQFTVPAPGGKRLIEYARTFLIFGADGKMRVEQRGTLPPQHLQGSTATALGWLVTEGALGSCYAAIVEHLRRHWGGQSNRKHLLHKRPTGQIARLHVGDQPTQIT